MAFTYGLSAISSAESGNTDLGLTVGGPGSRVTLAGASTYTGGTTVVGGDLVVTGSLGGIRANRGNADAGLPADQFGEAPSCPSRSHGLPDRAGSTSERP